MAPGPPPPQGMCATVWRHLRLSQQQQYHGQEHCKQPPGAKSPPTKKDLTPHVHSAKVKSLPRKRKGSYLQRSCPTAMTILVKRRGNGHRSQPWTRQWEVERPVGSSPPCAAVKASSYAQRELAAAVTWSTPSGTPHGDRE